MAEEIINRVASSGLLTLNLEELYPEGQRMALDLAPVLYQGIILREKEFRLWVKEHDWLQYQQAHVAVFCSEDAIIPAWAYMLVATKLAPYAKTVWQGSIQDLEKHLFSQALSAIDWTAYQHAKVVVKGCSHKPVPASAYTEVAYKLQAVAASIMYGEPCSTVPVYKAPRQKPD